MKWGQWVYQTHWPRWQDSVLGRTAVLTLEQIHTQGQPEAEFEFREPEDDGPLYLDDREWAKVMEREREAAFEAIVELAVETLDAAGKLAKYAALGRAALDQALWRKFNGPVWADADYSDLCRRVEDAVRARVAITHVDMDVYVRLHAWVEAVRPMVPGVERLSYYQAKNKFLSTLSWSRRDLSGEIKPGWVEFVRVHVARQVGDKPMPIKELDAAIAAHKELLERERAIDSGHDPVRLAERSRNDIDAKARAVRKESQDLIAESIDRALADGHVDGDGLMQIVDAVARDRNLTLPRVGFDPAHATAEDARLLAKAMWAASRMAEMKVLRDQLDVLIGAFVAAADAERRRAV